MCPSRRMDNQEQKLRLLPPAPGTLGRVEWALSRAPPPSCLSNDSMWSRKVSPAYRHRQNQKRRLRAHQVLIRVLVDRVHQIFLGGEKVVVVRVAGRINRAVDLEDRHRNYRRVLKIPKVRNTQYKTQWSGEKVRKTQRPVWRFAGLLRIARRTARTPGVCAPGTANNPRRTDTSCARSHTHSCPEARCWPVPPRTCCPLRSRKRSDRCRARSGPARQVGQHPELAPGDETRTERIGWMKRSQDEEA